MKKNLLPLILAVVCFIGVADAQTIILTEDFESGSPPAGWTRTQNTPSVGWEFATDLGSTDFIIPPHTRYACSNDDNYDDNSHTQNVADEDRLISPYFDLRPYDTTGVAIYFEYILPGNYGSSGHVEVSTDSGMTWVNVRTMPSSISWTSGFANLSAFTADSAVLFCFRHNDNGYWADGFAVDDLVFQTIPPVEAVLNDASMGTYGLQGNNYFIQLDVTNEGTDTITDLTVDWNDGTPHVANITGLSIPSGGSTQVNHPTPVNYATATEANIFVEIQLVNGIVDADTTNNCDSLIFHTVSSQVQHNVLFEIGTGTSDGWAPRAKVATDYMYATYPGQFIGITVHNADSMTNTAYDAALNFTNFPSTNVDRVMIEQPVTQTDFDNYFTSRASLLVPASVAVSNTWNSATRDMNITVSATFVTDFSSIDYRLGVILKENAVTGTGDGTNAIIGDYDQINFYAGGGQGPMGGFEGLPSPIPATTMSYDYVGRELIGGYLGQIGSVPVSVSDLQVVPQNFNFTLPANWNEANVTLIGVLIDQKDSSIVNAIEMPMNYNLSVEEPDNTIEMLVYPNPTSENATVKLDILGTEEVNLVVYDMSGRVLFTQDYGLVSGTQYLSIPAYYFPKGNYIVSIATKQKVYSRHLIVQ